jgi:hypothetical protein
VPTRSEPAGPGAIPEEWVAHRADARKVAQWWAEWERMPPLERRRPAAEVLAEVRGEDPYDCDDQ